MQYVNLLGMHSDCVDTRRFAKAFFDVFGIVDGEERESANYADGYYVKGSFNGLNFVVASSEEATNEDLPYWIHISTDVAEPDKLEARVAQLVRDNALPAGFRLAHIVNFGKRDERRIDY